MNGYNMLALKIIERIQGHQEYLDRRCVRRDGSPVRPDEALQYGYANNAATAHIFRDYSAYFMEALKSAQTEAELDVIATGCLRQLRRTISSVISNDGKPYHVAELAAHDALVQAVCADDSYGENVRKTFTERALSLLEDQVMRCAYLDNCPAELPEWREEYARLGGNQTELIERLNKRYEIERERKAKLVRNEKARQRRAAAKAEA